MSIVVAFLLKSFLSSLVLTSWYWLFLRNKKFHQYNRFYLLLTIIISLTIPLYQFTWIDLSDSKYDTLNKVVDRISQPAPWLTIIQLISVLISAALLFLLLFRIFSLYRIKKHSASRKSDGHYIIETSLKQAPFSFLNNLYWRSDISLSDHFGNKIYQHELIHIRQKHTYDKLFSQIVSCLFWMNPMYWIIQEELNLVHEFIADEKSIQPGDVETFSGMLLHSYDQGRYLNPSHSFFHSPIQRRLTMIANSSVSPSRLRKFSALPMIALVIFLCSFTIDKVRHDSLQKQRAEKIAAERVDQLNRERTIQQ